MDSDPAVRRVVPTVGGGPQSRLHRSTQTESHRSAAHDD
jgi:hypothetical protein